MNRQPRIERRKITQDIFDYAKEQHFRGEGVRIISELVQKKFGVYISSSTLTHVVKANTVEDYYALNSERVSTWYRDHVKKNNDQEEQVQKQPTPSLDRYARLKQFREKFDQVLVNFILEEIEANYTSLKMQNLALKQENDKLRKKNEELQQPDFLKSLKTAMDAKGGKNDKEENV